MDKQALRGIPADISRARGQTAGTGDALFIVWALGIAMLVRSFIPTQVVDRVVHYSTLGGTIFEKVHPGAYLLLALLVLTLMFVEPLRSNLRDRAVLRSSLALIGAIIFISIIGLATGRTQGFSYLLDSLVLGPAVCLVLLKVPDNYKYSLLPVILYLLVLNDAVLFAEFMTHKRVLPYDYVEDSFRPTAFLGHPLINGLINATAIGFVWVMSWSSSRKIVITLIFLAACFAAGARMASIFATMGALMCVWIELGRATRKGRIDEGTLITGAIVALGVLLAVIIVVVMTGLADRLISHGFFGDESSQARITIYGALRYLTWGQLMFGVTREWSHFLIIQVLNLPRSESPIVDYVMEFGIFGTTILMGSLIAFFWYLVRAANNAFVTVATMLFVATASTNNSFSTKGPPLALFAILLMAALGAPAVRQVASGFQTRRRTLRERPATAAAQE